MCIHAMLTFPSYHGEEGFLWKFLFTRKEWEGKSISALWDCEWVVLDKCDLMNRRGEYWISERRGRDRGRVTGINLHLFRVWQRLLSTRATDDRKTLEWLHRHLKNLITYSILINTRFQVQTTAIDTRFNQISISPRAALCSHETEINVFLKSYFNDTSHIHGLTASVQGPLIYVY